MAVNPYQVLGVASHASFAEIKAAYRELVKRHHPDTGGDEEKIVELNAAWELLGDSERRKNYDLINPEKTIIAKEAQQRGARNARASVAARVANAHSSEVDDALSRWLNQVYAPIDRLLAQVINPFPAQLRDLSADPYDEILMESFCNYLEQSRDRMEKINALYLSISIPEPVKGFGLSLYQCFSEVEDALAEFERYTMGYVDSYLHDGKEMLREAKQRRALLHQERRCLELK